MQNLHVVTAAVKMIDHVEVEVVEVDHVDHVEVDVHVVVLLVMDQVAVLLLVIPLA